MATRLRQCTAGCKNTGPNSHVGAGSLCQIPITATSIAYRGEAAHKHALHDGQGTQCGKYIGLVGRDVEVQMRCNHMNVAVDQAGHEGFTLGFHHLGVRCYEHVGLVGPNRLDQAVFNPNILAGFKLQGRHIKHIGRLKQDRIHKRLACNGKNHIKTDKASFVALGNNSELT